MRVFELARELNIPGKDLIDRMKALGYKVDGNFNVLDQKTIADVKSKMLEPVSRVVEQPSASEEEAEGEEEDRPRKRRIISARRSGEVRKIKESLGMEGPLPEDQKTREEVAPVRLKSRRAQEAEEAAEGPSGEAPEAQVAAEGAEAPLAAAAEPVAGAEGEEGAPAPEDGESTQAVGRMQAPRPVIGIPLPKPVDVDAAKAGARAPGEDWREPRKGRKRPEGAAPVEEAARGSWRDVKRERKGANYIADDDEWVRPRRGGARRRKGAPPPRMMTEEPKHTFNPRQKAIRIGNNIRVADLAGAIGVKAPELLRKLMALGTMATVNDSVDSSTAELLASEYDVSLEVFTGSPSLDELIKEEEIPADQLSPRPPIVTIMGHVDHGKTTLLDYIRKSHITSGEAGGITQHIGAYYVKSDAGDIVFLDTPGHEAFTSLRRRGANVTDLVVLIVAADDGVMPQTVEAIEHAQAAEVPILVAMNKMDRPNADPDKIKRQLMEHGLVPEEYGGDTVMVPISAVSGDGVPQLLEMIHLQAELLELGSTTEGRARGHIIESQMDRRRGPVATVLVERGTLRIGDHFVAGYSYGRVRAMVNDRGEAVEFVTPSMPVEVLGFGELPQAGDLFAVMEDEHAAREAASLRAAEQREEAQAPRLVSLEDFLQQAGPGAEQGTLNMVIKADTQGSLEAIRSSLEKEGDERIRVNVIRAGVGGITETDVNLAATSNAVVIGFNVRAETKAGDLARSEGVDIKAYTIIYELLDDVHAALQGLLKPVVREEVIGHMEVRDVFSTTKDGRIAGGYVTDGRMERNVPVRVYRDDVIIHTGMLNSLRRFKDDVPTVQSGFECGFRVANFNDLRQGDQIEAFMRVEEAAKLERAGRSA
ncbi:MAG TPA: translation initiation factor IF-2 [bacterium]|nr:translation initiation factor IF-2 [bacterium]